MEQLKVKNKDILVVNLIIFLLLSFVFLYLQYAYRHHLSPFSLVFLRKSFELFWYALVPLVTCSILVWKHHRFSASLFTFCISLVSYKVTEGLFIEFNKIIVITLFFYLVIYYSLYQLYVFYLSSAYLNANYINSDLFPPLLKDVPCLVKFEQNSLVGHLTNWDNDGCFLKLDHPLESLPGKIRVQIDFKGRSFEQDGEVVAHSVDFTGVGIKFGKTPKGLNIFNWAEFNELVHELGYKPERLR